MNKAKQAAPPISCTFVGGPLDGQRITVPGDLGSYHCTVSAARGPERHVYYRRAHPSAFREDGSKAAVVPSPPVFDYQPALTLSRAEREVA